MDPVVVEGDGGRVIGGGPDSRCVAAGESWRCRSPPVAPPLESGVQRKRVFRHRLLVLRLGDTEGLLENGGAIALRQRRIDASAPGSGPLAPLTGLQPRLRRAVPQQQAAKPRPARSIARTRGATLPRRRSCGSRTILQSVFLSSSIHPPLVPRARRLEARATFRADHSPIKGMI